MQAWADYLDGLRSAPDEQTLPALYSRFTPAQVVTEQMGVTPHHEMNVPIRSRASVSDWWEAVLEANGSLRPKSRYSAVADNSRESRPSKDRNQAAHVASAAPGIPV
jgi:hypothetical protein